MVIHSLKWVFKEDFDKPGFCRVKGSGRESGLEKMSRFRVNHQFCHVSEGWKNAIPLSSRTRWGLPLVTIDRRLWTRR